MPPPDRFAAHSTRPLAEHVAAYRAHVLGKGSTARHADQTAARLTRVFAGCGFSVLQDLDAAAVSAWLAAIAAAADPVTLPPGDVFGVRQAAELLGLAPSAVRSAVARGRLQPTAKGRATVLSRATVEALAGRHRGTGEQTRQHYVRALRAFGRWLVRPGRRCAEDPFDGLPAPRVVERRRLRRELAAGELALLLNAARSSARTFRGLAGPARFHLYAVACGTGFRAGALASLTPESFDLGGEVASVTLSRRADKSRRGKVQPLPADVAELLRAWLPTRPAGRPVWPGTWSRSGAAAEMLRRDLAAAGVPYAVEGPDGPLYADFHSLRHTYLTLGGRAGIDLRTLQELAGHSTPTLTARYSHRRLADLAGAVGKLPELLPGVRSQEAGVRSQEAARSSLPDPCLLTPGPCPLTPEPADLPLGRVNAAWPGLPEALRQAVLALVEAGTTNRGHSGGPASG